MTSDSLTTPPQRVASSAPQESIFDGCTAAAHVAYANSDAAFIFPITPSTLMAESVDLWSHQGRLNVFGQTTIVRQMQSEGGAAGAVHGSLAVGSLTTTFTASQGLLLMVPNMYKIAGELISCVFHVSARAIATQALSIFGDHSDVMAVRQCGWGILSSSDVQEAMDLAMVAHMATLKSSVPFVHFFDGFRISHCLQKIKVLDNETMNKLIDHDAILRHRNRGLNPTNPHLTGSAQGPEVLFQNMETVNKFYDKTPEHVETAMEEFFTSTGRRYKLYDYYGHPEASDVIVIMGAGVPVVKEVVDYLMQLGDDKTSKIGLVNVHLFRPWKLDRFIEAFPGSVQRVAVLDRCKESGSLGEPLFLDVAASFQCVQRQLYVIGGRYGLGSKDFTPAMALAVYQNLQSDKRQHPFTVGIEDDVTNLSLNFKVNRNINTVPKGTTECLFWGMGSDGTVGANKNVIKIIGDHTALNVQGYFAYSAHKAGGLTVSHLRFGPQPITSQYLIQHADYVACHRHAYVNQYRMLDNIKTGGVFVLNCPWTDEELESNLPGHFRRTLAQKQIRFYTIDANKVAVATKMGRRVNNILMTVFFKFSGVLPFEEAISLFKAVIKKTYEKKGMHVVEANWNAVDAALDASHQVQYDSEEWSKAADTNNIERRRLDAAPDFVQSVLLPLERLEGDDLPVSKFSPYAGGVLPLGTSAYEKRGIALNVPIVDMDKCTQCNYCSFVCPHAAIRPFLIDDDEAEQAPKEFVMKKAKGAPEIAPYKYRIQVSPLDCTGCELCSIACPDDCLTMIPLEEVRNVEETNWNFAVNLLSREHLVESSRTSIKGSQFYTPLMEFSGACEGCGETPYIKLLTQLFGERMIIANATGCSSIYGASYPSVPYTKNQKGYGPAWGNSLFEDNAEYGYGMIVALQHRRERYWNYVKSFLKKDHIEGLNSEIYEKLNEFVENWQEDAAACTRLYGELTEILNDEIVKKDPLLKKIREEKSLITKFSHWVIGGDGWAYDIGYGGLDHVIASGIDVNILVLDTEVYSNTGGQISKATPMGAVHKFGSGGHLRNKKDLGMIAMEYGNVYVASVASSANMSQVVRAFVEAEKHPGPSVILAYSPCIEHGYIKPFSAQKVHCTMAVESGYWPLYRYNPLLELQGEFPLQLDCKKLKVDVRELLRKENRFAQLNRTNPEMAKLVEDELYRWVNKRFENLKARSCGLPSSLASQTLDTLDSGIQKVYILYGSETGNAEDVANRIAALMKQRTLTPKVMQLDEVEVDELAEMQNVIVVCSTAGQGEMPGNAKILYETLEKKEFDDRKDLLSKMSFAVFGLGDSSYIFFNESAKKYDQRFIELGAKRLIPCGLGDDQHEEKYDTALGEWLSEYWIESKSPDPQNVSDEPDESMYTVEEIKTKIDVKRCIPYGGTLVKVDINRRITPDDYDVEVRHLEFDLTGTGIRYALGDSLAIFPQSDPNIIQEFCQFFGFDPEMKIRIKKTGSESSAKHEALFKYPMSINQLLSECLDIGGKPNRMFYEILYKYCTDPEEKENAKGILNKENKEKFMTMTNKEMVHCFDILKKFPSLKKALTLSRLIDLIPLHKPRYYSIASSQKFVGENRLHLCIGIVDWTTSNNDKRFGGCTGYIRRSLITEGSAPIYFSCSLKATAFNMPPTDQHPIIMAGMGTGLAPFRAFIQYRAYLKRSGKEIGPVVLYFGCRYSKKDYLYGDELCAFAEEGVISDLKIAFSRDQKEKFYVQHHIDRDQPLLYKRLVSESGSFYLCGSAKQVPIDIRAAVVRAIVAIGNLNEEEASDMVNQMQIKGQYNVEAW